MRTRVPLLVVAAVLPVLTILPNVRGADVPDLPLGVQPGQWVQLSDMLGFVVERERTSGELPSVEGHFMVKRGGTWCYLNAHAAPAFRRTG
jgi:hypothetical protein